jgi:integrase
MKRMREQKEHIFMMYTLAIYTGMRRGEILGLRWRDIDLERKRIYVEHSHYYISGEGLILQSPKTSSGKINISITDDVIEDKVISLTKTSSIIKSWNENKMKCILLYLPSAVNLLTLIQFISNFFMIQS